MVPDTGIFLESSVNPDVVKDIHLQEIQNLLWIKGLTDNLQNCATTALELWESKQTVFKLRINSSQTELRGL